MNRECLMPLNKCKHGWDRHMMSASSTKKYSRVTDFQFVIFIFFKGVSWGPPLSLVHCTNSTT
jgi:hypothetical protein